MGRGPVRGLGASLGTGGEHGYGTALITDSTYGYDTSRETRADGGTTTTVRLTLLRAPHSPDATADLGRHRFRYALAPGATTGATTGDAIAEGHALNLPLRVAGAAPTDRTPPLVRIDNPGVVAESVKLARVSGISLAVPEAELQWRPGLLMHGVRHLPVSFEPVSSGHR